MNDEPKTLAKIAAEYAEAVRWLESLPKQDVLMVSVKGADYQVDSMLTKKLRQYLPQTYDAVKNALQEHVAQKRQALDEAEKAKANEKPHLRPVT